MHRFTPVARAPLASQRRTTLLPTLDDVVCVCVGEVRAPSRPDQQEPDLVIDVAELVWEEVAP
jgi:hypothetical protein